MYVVAYETSGQYKILLDHTLSIDDVCNRRLLSFPSKVDMVEGQEYFKCLR